MATCSSPADKNEDPRHSENKQCTDSVPTKTVSELQNLCLRLHPNVSAAARSSSVYQKVRQKCPDSAERFLGSGVKASHATLRFIYYMVQPLYN